MIELFQFQQAAADNIAQRFHTFVHDPERPRQKGYGVLPFYQTLQALTGAGKTPILAEAVAQMRQSQAIEPIVLWVSKAKVVVDQTFVNFSDGGKYHHLLENFYVSPLSNCDPNLIDDDSTALLLLGTVATFNSKERGERLIFGAQLDKGGPSLWERLIKRETAQGHRRPLIIVYDEGHNLSDQQANLLMELKPDAIVLASATPKLPGKMGEIVELLARNGYSDEDFRTTVDSKAVLDAQLVKREIHLGGYVTAEELAIAAMIEDHAALQAKAEDLRLNFSPKCIYVCKTNIKGDELKPFTSREAPPIRIWRYLVNECEIDPQKIAVYCNLDVSRAHPLPDEFILFRGGENDYADFVEGNYEHIIFNLSLQEGWDDPECYFAYIDKSMGSETQIEQIIGRVLRQPGSQHYPDPRLNACGFYIHVDEAGVFMDMLKQVRLKLTNEMPSIEIKSTGGDRRTLQLQEAREEVVLPTVMLDMQPAAEFVQQAVDGIGVYNRDTEASGRVARVTQEVGEASEIEKVTWIEQGIAMAVPVRWLFTRIVNRQYPDALAVCDLSDTKFAAKVRVGSQAAKQVERDAQNVVEVFLEHVRISTLPGLNSEIPMVYTDTTKADTFIHSIHPSYSGLNELERQCAQALDNLGWPWCRNPENGGYALPLLEPGTSRRFFPDFIVWPDNAIWLIDTKGDHLIKQDAGKKIMALESAPSERPIRVCLITLGEWDKTFNKRSNSGVTAWRLRAGLIGPERFPDFATLLESLVGPRANVLQPEV